ncbi:hypothetical protein T552_03245 [Pneumocystis carinii B80]|uniref:Uncharacterized protein n=1 Tax=Pneumocystis carinii (strain B80) TaxID=1408658 RepID=A0A0W4ZCB1_PNEC8|nr:hypothetical protein T552_03245 [Pneumocystis carinii B80]KTW25971.1 hypothetical protein T552_03245 [Pneumocystis carinii B80]
MDVQEERIDEEKSKKTDENKTILDLSDGVIYFGTPTSAEKRLHAMETPPKHISSRRKTILLPSKAILYSAGNSNQQENCKERKSRRQSYLYATKNSVMLEQQRLQEIMDDKDFELYSNNSMEENLLFTEAPGSIERKIKKKNDTGKLFLTPSTCQRRVKTLRRFSVFNTMIPRSIPSISRRKSTSLLLQKQNKIMHDTHEKNILTPEMPLLCCIRIQATIRGYLIRKSIFLQNQAARIIQLKYITILSKRRFSLQKRSAIIIQSAWRGWLGRMRYLEMIEACICIQKWWRQLSKEKKAKQTKEVVRVEEREVIKNISNNSSLHGFLKKWESKKALVTATKDKNIKEKFMLEDNNTSTVDKIKENIPPRLTEELSSPQKPNLISNQSPKSFKKTAKQKISSSDSRSASSMTLMLKQSISTARILSNPTNSILSTTAHNYCTSFQNRSKLPRSRLAAPGFASKTSVLTDVSPNLLNQDTIDVLNTPAKKNKVDGVSAIASKVSTPSPRKNPCLTSPLRKTTKKNQLLGYRKTALLAPQNINSMHFSHVIPESTSPQKNINHFVNNGLSSPSRHKIINQSDLTSKNLEVNNEERNFPTRSRTTESKTLSTSTLQSYTSAIKNIISQNLSGSYRSLNYLTLGEITKMTRQNTYQNRIYRCDFNRVIVRKNYSRPPSPTAKSQSKLAAEARIRRRKFQKEKKHDYALGPGDDDNWIPKELTSLKKGVKWNKLLESEIGEPNHGIEKLNSSKIKVQKGCLSKKTKLIRLDDLGNVLDAREPLTPVIGKAETVIIQKFLYKGEEDE